MTRAHIFLFLLLTLICSPTFFPAASAQISTDNSDEYDETSRVVRISFLRNTVSLKRAGNNQWEQAALNLPLVEGDTIATENDARAEIQIDARNFVRLDGGTVLRVVTLRDEGIALSVIEGTASLRLARFEKDKEYFEIDAPGATLAAEKTGLYRLDVTRDGDVRASVRDGGRARVYSETSGFTLRDNRSARLISGGSAAGDWELADAPVFDELDRWADDRERYLAARLKYEQRDRYYDANVWGAEELDAYGDWSRHDQYGWVWRPHVTVIRNYVDWAPYRYGNWRWCPPYGWTWVGDEPWGWAPYHHGRWVYVNNDWCWAPRGYGYSYRRSWWRPALVAFVYLPSSRGEYISWYPLGYGQRDPRSRYWQGNFGRNDRLNPLRRDEIAGLRRVNPIYQRAVNVLPARDFGNENARARPATSELARRAISGDPVIGRLPVTPRAPRTIGGVEDNRDRIAGDRGTRRIGGVPAWTTLERQTGAATRAPGVALGEELRRARVYQGREPRRPRADEAREPNGIDRDANGVGAVERRRNVLSRPIPRGLEGDDRLRDERAPLTRIP
ncbi:MAG TPA: DUF6600 domain-containing protein, partial [Pyrinomonadaceae bacterium]|nr:DUF6600 domain-containing protein [Pyrinomonadaceae bacterium]